MTKESDAKPTVWEMVIEALTSLGGSASNAEVRKWIWKKYPGTNRSTIDCQMTAGCVNVPSRVHYGVGRRPRPASNPDLDKYFRPEKSRIEFYDPQKHGKWEIFAAPDGKLSVRQVAEWPAGSEVKAPAATVAPAIEPAAAVSIVGKSAGEVEWMRQLQPTLEAALQSLSFGGTKLRVDAGYRLPYAYEVLSYRDQEPNERRAARYQTDLLIYDEVDGGKRWVPRVVIECKIKGVTTHDALTYSGKAATHKQVHPYLRYGILVGSYGAPAVPSRLVRHGAFFDFMAVWEDADPSKVEWEELLDVLTQEVRASRLLQEMLCGDAKSKKAFRMLHRPLRLKFVTV